MRIGIEINGVLRDTIGKISQVYQKNLIDGYEDYFSGNTFILEENGETKEIDNYSIFEYGIISDVTTLNLMNHFKFQSEDELYNFLYNEHTMEIFGHAGSVELSGMVDLNNFYLDMRGDHEIIIVSDEIGKSKPASLFFLSKFGCLVENVKFYSESTIKSLWDSIDVLLTANNNLLLNYPDNKVIIKYKTRYNNEINSIHSISKIKQLKNKILEII
jgi:hypothetical protein